MWVAPGLGLWLAPWPWGPGGGLRTSVPQKCGVVSPRACPGKSWAGVVAETATSDGGEGGRPGVMTRVVASPRAGLFISWLPAPPGTAALGTRDAKQQQHDDGADYGADDSCGVERVDRHRVVLDQVLYEATHEGADDAKDDGAQDADGVGTGDEQARDQASDETDDNQNDNESDHGRLIPKYGADIRPNLGSERVSRFLESCGQ